MTDLTHDHLAFGFKPGCPGCEQTLRDFGTINAPEEVFLRIAAENAERWKETLAILAG